MTEVSAALIWREGRFLICQRPAHKTRGLEWEFVGGKREPGETGEQALIRECREELGITVSPRKIYMQLTHTYPDITVRLTLYEAEIAEGEPRLLEHADMRWIAPMEIPLFRFCPADRVILEKIAAYGLARIETPRLLLRKARREDLKDIWPRVWGDEVLADTMLWTPSLTGEEAAERLKRTLIYQARYPAFFVCLKETDKAIGFAGVYEREPEIFEESGVCIAREHQGKGYGKEVLQALIELVFKRFGGRRFYYGTLSDNARSAALCKAFGFTYAYSEKGVRQRDGKAYQADYYLLER